MRNYACKVDQSRPGWLTLGDAKLSNIATLSCSKEVICGAKACTIGYQKEDQQKRQASTSALVSICGAILGAAQQEC